jgi:8-oxo-dGTP pyrophosphatase MutT (NUDIX family)
MKSRSEISAGGVVYRLHDGQFQFLICKDAGYHRWVFPKGLVRKAESEDYAATALREVEEETGIRARLIQPIGEPEQYIYTARGIRVFKSVYYYLMQFEAGDISTHDHEMEEVRWVSAQVALDMLAYEGAKNVLRQSLAILEVKGKEGKR